LRLKDTVVDEHRGWTNVEKVEVAVESSECVNVSKVNEE
jgi:hypothetical protein